MKEQKRVAVIGSGLAGLTAAYLLRREGAEVWLIEKANKLGFHSQSVDVLGDAPEKAQRKEKWVVDVPMRSFQGGELNHDRADPGYYPLLLALYRHLAIPMTPTYYTFSFSHLHASPHFIHTGASGLFRPALPSRAYNSLPALYRAIRHFVGIAAAYLLWLVIAALSWHNLIPRQTTLRQLTKTTSYQLTYPLSSFSASLPRSAALPTPLGQVFSSFVHDIILPLFSAVGTMTTTDVLDSPIGSLLDYVHSTVGTSHFTLAGCSAGTVAKRLASAVKEQGSGHLRLGEDVLDLRSEDGEVFVRCKGGDIVVDQVVLATQASAASVLLGMLQRSLSGAEKERVAGMRSALGEVEYRETIVVTHRDWSILPDPTDRREINLSTPSNLAHPSVQDETPPLSSTSESSHSSFPATPTSAVPYFLPQPDWVYTMGTHVISSPCPGVEAVLQTTNPVCPIDESTVLAVSRMERYVKVGLADIRALPLRDPSIFSRLHPPADNALVYLAGSYAYPGIPLLEGCVGSAVNAAAAIMAQPRTAVGGVDWTRGRGGRLGRLWRWRRSGFGG